MLKSRKFNNEKRVFKAQNPFYDRSFDIRNLICLKCPLVLISMHRQRCWKSCPVALCGLVALRTTFCTAYGRSSKRTPKFQIFSQISNLNDSIVDRISERCVCVLLLCVRCDCEQQQHTAEECRRHLDLIISSLISRKLSVDLLDS